MRLARPAAAALFLAAAACSNGPAARPPPVGELVPGVHGVTSFLQAVPLAEPYDAARFDIELFPGCANLWDLANDFSLIDGGNDQWDGALELWIGTLATSPATFDSVTAELGLLAPFAHVGGYEALRYATPGLSAAEVPVAVASDGALLDQPALTGTSAYLAPTLDSRLQQLVDLRAATAPVTLALVDRVWLHAYGFGTQPPSFEIVVRSAVDGGVLATLVTQTGSSDRTTRALDLSAFAGERIVLSFELRSEPEDGGNALAAIDDVSVLDAAGHELVTNGGFEQQGLSGWTLAGDPGVRQLVSAAVPVGELVVTRSFYTAPRLLWARWVDELENPGSAPVTRDVVYRSELGSDGAGIIYAAPGATGALSAWDGSDVRDGADRDVALVHGDGIALFRSAAELSSSCVPVPPATSCGWDGDDRIYVVHAVTVPAGGKVTLVHFIAMNGENTGRTATSVADRAAGIDAVAAEIANGFGMGKAGGYADHLTASQAATLENF